MSAGTMTVEEFAIRMVRMPLVHPFRTSFGEETERETVIVSATSQGRTGFGEAPVARLPGYAYETSGTAFHVLRDLLAPRVANRPLDGPRALPGLFEGLKGHPMARAGLEAALWDLSARLEGVSLAAHCGGRRKEIDVGVSIGIQPDRKALLARIEEFLEQGYRRVKIKIRPGWDVEIASEVRRVFPELRLWADANQAYRREDLDRMKGIDAAGLELLEQPLHESDLLGHARWAEALETPLCLDESVKDPYQLENALDLKALQVLNIKPPRVGGMLASFEMESRCAEAGIPVWCGGLLETGIGRLHNVVAASREGFALPGDISASGRYFARDVIVPPVTLTERGTLEVPRGVGLGHDVDIDYLDAVTVRKAAVTG